MRITDRNVFFAILAVVAAVGIGYAELTHRAISLVGLFGGLVLVLAGFGVCLAAVWLRLRSWTRTNATIEHVHVQYFHTVKGGDNWQVAMTYVFSPAGASGLAPVRAQETLQFHGHGREKTLVIEHAAKAGRQVLVDYNPRAPAKSRIVTKGEDPVFAAS